MVHVVILTPVIMSSLLTCIIYLVYLVICLNTTGSHSNMALESSTVEVTIILGNEELKQPFVVSTIDKCS